MARWMLMALLVGAGLSVAFAAAVATDPLGRLYDFPLTPYERSVTIDVAAPMDHVDDLVHLAPFQLAVLAWSSMEELELDLTTYADPRFEWQRDRRGVHFPLASVDPRFEACGYTLTWEPSGPTSTRITWTHGCQTKAHLALWLAMIEAAPEDRGFRSAARAIERKSIQANGRPMIQEVPGKRIGQGGGPPPYGPRAR